MTPLRTSPAIRPGARRAESPTIAQPQRVAGRDPAGRRPGGRAPAFGA